MCMNISLYLWPIELEIIDQFCHAVNLQRSVLFHNISKLNTKETLKLPQGISVVILGVWSSWSDWGNHMSLENHTHKVMRVNSWGKTVRNRFALQFYKNVYRFERERESERKEFISFYGLRILVIHTFRSN